MPALAPTDRALLDAFRGGDEFAFVALYNRYKGPVYTFCARYVLDRALAEDLMQEAFVRAYENRERLAHVGSFKAWVFTIARNACLNHLRKAGRTEPLGTREPLATETPIARLEKSEQVQMVQEVLARLSPEYREVIVLREYQGLAYDEIAAVTRTTVSSVKSRLFKARRKIGVLLAPLLAPSADAAPVPPSGAAHVR